MTDTLDCKCHLWIGTSFQDEKKYMSYFELDYSTEGDFSDPAYKKCLFCTDLGIDWYDEDFICIIPRFDSEVDLDTLLQETPVRSEEIIKIKERCSELGIKKANAVFCYSVPTGDHPRMTIIDFDTPQSGKNYNGLVYVGAYEE